MKAFCLHQADPAAVALVPREVPRPLPAAGEVLVQVHATGTTTGELGWYPNLHTKSGAPRLHAVPAHEFSGVVAMLGESVSEFQVGDAVFGMNDWFADGAAAEYCLTTPAMIAAKPAELSHVDAASFPISALTAWQGLFAKAKLQPGETALIHGGSGAVGMFAIQLAKSAGARVLTTASARNTELLMGLGADLVIDYRAGWFDQQIAPVDVIFDAVGGETLQRSWSVLKSAGRLVTVASSSEETQDERTKAAFFIVEPHHEQLRRLVELLRKGELRTEVASVVPFAETASAYLGAGRSPGKPGKVVISVLS